MVGTWFQQEEAEAGSRTQGGFAAFRASWADLVPLCYWQSLLRSSSISGLVLKDNASEPRMLLREKIKLSPLEPHGPQATATVVTAATGAAVGAQDVATTIDLSSPTPAARPRDKVT